MTDEFRRSLEYPRKPIWHGPFGQGFVYHVKPEFIDWEEGDEFNCVIPNETGEYWIVDRWGCWPIGYCHLPISLPQDALEYPAFAWVSLDRLPFLQEG